MATYSTSLQIKLITDGTESGTWGSSTNTNWNLMEQAVAGVQSITMINADYTLTVVNGASDEARNAVLVVGGTNSAVRKVVAPLVPKVYVVFNNTVGGYAITIGGATGTTATIPSATSCLVYCDGANFYAGVTGSSGNFAITGNETVGGTLSVAGTTTLTGAAALNGGGTSTTPTVGDNTTKIATTAFVSTAVVNATAGLGTMASQNANNVNITGGSISGITALPVASGGTGSSSLTANNVLLGNGTSAVQAVAPGTSGNVLTSNGTTWASTAPSPLGLGVGQTWSAPSRSPSTSYTNSTSKPIYVLVILGMSFSGSGNAQATVDGVTVGAMSYDTTAGGSGCPTTLPFIVPAGKTYSVSITGGFSIQSWSELA